MDIPVYLFTGFLEAGKTSFILETLRDPSFLDPKKKYLVITCEEGIFYRNHPMRRTIRRRNASKANLIRRSRSIA